MSRACHTGPGAPRRAALGTLFAAAALLAACGGGGGGGAAPSPAPSPTPGAVALARVDALPAGSSCPEGGRSVAVGLDTNANGRLDDAEVGSRAELCNGRGAAAGLNALARVDALPAGAACPTGGLQVRAGLDADRDGSLASAETAHSAQVCNGTPGAAGPAQLIQLSPADGAGGCAGGTRIASGLDLDGNGLLSAAETSATRQLCPGLPGAAAALPLLAVSAEPAGATCPQGGQRVASGLDTDGNGRLDTAEVTSTTVLCTGPTGASGVGGAAGADSLLRLGAETAGLRCPAGGTRVDAGADRNANGALDDDEVTSTRYLCQGTAGGPGANAAPPLLAVRPEAPGANCTNGGRRLDGGADRNGDGTLGPDEVSASGYVCDGATGSRGSDGQNGLVRVQPVALGDAACPAGGQRVASGLDANRSGVLDDAEVGSVELVCNASPGAPGAGGSNGANALVVTTAVAPGTPCATGGQTVRRGVDSNRNGVLDSAEVAATTLVCNGTDSAGFVWNVSDGAALSAAENQGFVTTRADGEATVTLPTQPRLGALYRVSGAGAGGWVLAQSAGQQIVFAESGDLVRRSDLYRDWLGLGNTQTWQAVAGSGDLGVLLGAVRGGELQLSYDGGSTWVARGGSALWQAVAVDATGRRLVAVQAGGQIYTSVDSGSTWTARDSNRNWSSVASSSDGLRLLAADRGGRLYTSTDGGSTWTARESARSWAAVASSRDGRRLVAAAAGGALYTSADGGATWVARGPTGTWTAVASSARGDRLLAADYGGNLHLSSDGGATWQARGPSLGWGGVAMSADGGRLVAVADNGTLVASDDGGATWTQRAALGAAAGVTLSADGADAVQVLVGGTVRRSWGVRRVTATSIGLAGRLRGGQGSTAELQFLGVGTFLLRQQEGTLFVD